MDYLRGGHAAGTRGRVVSFFLEFVGNKLDWEGWGGMELGE